MPRPIPPFGGEDWLSQLISYSAQNNVCTRHGCTTCGAVPFRSSLWAAAQSGSAVGPVEAIVGQLARLTDIASEEAVRLVLCELDARVGAAELLKLSQAFARRPAGDVYRRALAHYEMDLARHREWKERHDPVNVARRRADKRATKAAAHAARLAAKAIRDAERDLDLNDKTRPMKDETDIDDDYPDDAPNADIDADEAWRAEKRRLARANAVSREKGPPTQDHCPGKGGARRG